MEKEKARKRYFIGERRIRYPEITKDMGMQRGMEPRRRILDLDPRAVHQRSGCCLTRHKLRRPAAFQEIIQLSLRDRRWKIQKGVWFITDRASYALNVYHTGHVPREEMKRESFRPRYSISDTRDRIANDIVRSFVTNCAPAVSLIESSWRCATRDTFPPRSLFSLFSLVRFFNLIAANPIISDEQWKWRESFSFSNFR